MKNKLLSIFAAAAVFAGIGSYNPAKAYAATAKTQSQAAEWANSLIGTKAVDMDGAYGAQCVDFIQQYYSWLGVYGGGGNACDYAWNTLPSGFTRIANYYGFVPDPGDIAVWTVGSGGVTAGHVGVIISADLNTLTVADVYGSVNETPYRKVHKSTYYYNGGGMQFWGVIRPNFANVSSPVQSFDSFDTIPEGTYYLYNRATDLALNLAYNNDANCENVHTYEYHSDYRSQLMSITSCSADGKTYKIRPVDANRLIQMYGDRPYDGANVCIYDDLANFTQWWKFKNIDNGYVIMIDCDTNYALSSVSGDAILNTYTGAGDQIWELIPYNPTYTINYNGNGNTSGYMSSEEVACDTTVNLQKNSFERFGYRFKGWSLNKDATTAQYTDGQSVRDLTQSGSVTLYAVWEHIDSTQLTGLRAEQITADSVTLLWDKSEADGYDVYKDDVLICRTTGNTLTVTDLFPATTYTFVVTPYVKGASYSVGSGKRVTTLSGLEVIAGAAGAVAAKDHLSSDRTSTTTSEISNIKGNTESASTTSSDTENTANSNTSGIDETAVENAEQASNGSSSGENNSTTKTAGVGAAISTSVGALVLFLKKLFGK